MSERPWAEMLDTIVALACAASDVVAAAYARADVRVDYKSPGDPVTDADREANALLVGRLAELYPDAALVGEESLADARGDRARAELAVFVDPLDGTRDFVDRTGEFAVMIGVAEAGVAALGVVLEPATGRGFAAAPGLGAFAFRRESPHARNAIHVRERASAAGGRMLLSRTRARPETLAVAERLGMETVRTGSAGVKGARVACGEADAYVHLGTAGYLWDVAAVDAIVRGAGGRFTDQDGAAFDYRRPGYANDRGVVCASPAIHEAVLRVVREGGLP